MKRAIVVGMGDMGVAVAYGLYKLGHEVILVDNDEATMNASREKLDSFGMNTQLYYICTAEKIFAYIDAQDDNVGVVVSAVPYHATEKVAQAAIEARIPYCDLGGNPEVSSRILSLAAKNYATAKIFTDLGLAPGYANILAESYFKKGRGLENMCIRVGGLPAYPHNFLKYNAVFSIDGLVNEYLGESEVVEKGKRTTVDALAGYEPITVHNINTNLVDNHYNTFECFHTKGGLSHTLFTSLLRDAQNVSYKTIRFAGHHDYIKFLIHDCKMDEQQLRSTLKTACPPTVFDFVIISIDVDAVTAQTIIYYDRTWTAMQKATAFPTASIASMICEEEMPPKMVWNYSNVPEWALYKKLKIIDNKVQWELKEYV